MGEDYEYEQIDSKYCSWQKVPEKTNERQKICVVRRSRRKLAPSEPDPQTPYLTGRYESSHFTCMINQAGKHVVCWLAWIQSAQDNAESKAYFKLNGDRQDDGSFRLYPHTDPTQTWGTLEAKEKKVKLALSILGIGAMPEQLLERISVRPTLSEAVVEHLQRQFPNNRTDMTLLKSLEWAPIPNRWVNWLYERLIHNSVLNAYPVREFLEKYDGIKGDFFELPVATDNKRFAVIASLERYIDEALNDEGAEGWHRDDLPLARYFAQQQLWSNTLQFRNRRYTLMAAIEETVNYFHNEASLYRIAPSFQKLKDHLGLEVSKRKEPFCYLCKMTVFGPAIGPVHGFAGQFVVWKYSNKRVAEQNENKPDEEKKEYLWTESYSIIFGGGGLSVAVKVKGKSGGKGGFSTTGKALSFADFDENELNGVVDIIDVSAEGGLIVGAGLGATLLSVHGTGRHAKLVFDLSGVSVNLMIGLGVGINVSFGYLATLGLGFYDNVDGASQTKDYRTDIVLDNKAHFVLGDAFLTEPAKQALRVFCANELASLTVEPSCLAIKAYTDRVDTEDKNLVLSMMRAENAARAVIDILGEHLGIPHDKFDVVVLTDDPAAAQKALELDGKTGVIEHEIRDGIDDAQKREKLLSSGKAVILHAYGERPAKDAGDEDGQINATFRRVDVVLRSRLVIALREPLKGKDTDGVKIYGSPDPKHRFPDLYRQYVKTKAQRECRKSDGRPDLDCYRKELKDKLGE